MKKYDIRRKMEMTRRYTAAAATAEEKEAAVSKAHDYVMLGYTLLNAADIVLRRTEDIMSKVDSRYRYDDHFRIRESLKELRRVIDRTDRGSVGVDAAVNSADALAYDRLRGNAYEVLRFVMLLYTRTCDNPKATEALERNIRRMAGNGMFTDDEIAAFQMR